jgi:AraC-like DNA-binding protein
VQTAISHFVSQQLIEGVANLSEASLHGLWPNAFKDRHTQHKFPPSVYSREHSHLHTEVCHLLSGSCLLSYQGTHYKMHPGDLTFFPPGVVHAETFYQPRISYQLAWWVLMEEEPFLQLTDYRKDTGFRIINRVSLPRLSRETSDRMESLKLYASDKKIPPVLDLKENFLTLSTELLRCLLSGNKSKELDTRSSIIDLAISYIRSHSDQPIELEDVGQAVLLSPNYLTTLFRTHTGKTLGSFIKEERIKRSVRLLKETGKSVKEIAAELGFTDQFSFSRTFKRIKGVSPHNFRNNL